MKRKIIALGLSVALILVAAVSSTLAYLTDSDQATNVFTVGDVKIKLIEDADVKDVAGNSHQEKYTRKADGVTYKDLVPTNEIVKKVTVVNEGKSPAYVRVLVVFNNTDKINSAIDTFYENKWDAAGDNAATILGAATKDEYVQSKYEEIFVDWGINYTNTPTDTSFAYQDDMRNTISGSDMPAGVMKVDSAERITNYGLMSPNNWFKNEYDPESNYWTDGNQANALDGYYVSLLNKYEACYAYYMYLEPKASVTLFKGLNVPAEFEKEQLAMFDGLKIEVYADAIQTEGFNANLNDDPDDDDVEIAKKAFIALEEAHPLKGLHALVDTWDGTADTSWYNDTDTEFTLTTAEALAGLAKLVDEGNNFAGKTIKLANGVDLYLEDENGDRVSFDPIGDDVAFAGTFDGDGHTIENLYQSGWDFSYDWYNYGSIGLFGELESATVKNLTVSGAETLVEGGDVGGICGSATGTCVFENITIEDSNIATYNNGNGGIIGWSGSGNYTFKNITIAEDVTLAGLWGSFDSSIGGIVGQGEPGATYNFENVNINCRLDVYNDCTASYDYYNYRMCGMIIGRLAKTTTIDGVNYPDMSQYNITCNNVTVTYGDWANYHYCEPTPGYNNGRGMRVEPGYSYDGLPADFDHSQCIINHNTLIPFDQIFGGDQLGVTGLKTYDGVTVIYNNK